MIRPLLLLCASTLLTIAGFAGALPAAATAMEAQGLGSGVIGVITSFVYFGVLVMAPFQPRLAGRFGAVVTYQLGKGLSACGFAGLALAHGAWSWSLATLFIGIGAGLTWPVTDSLVASFAPPEKKGAWMGMFQTGMGASFALGPFIAAALTPAAMFVAAAVTTVLSSLPLIGRRAEITKDARAGVENVRQIVRIAPHLAMLGFLGGFFENGTHTAITLTSLALAWDGSAAISLAGVVGIGAFVAQYPIGRMADRYGARRIILVTLGIMMVGCLPLPLCRAVPSLLWVVALLWGAAGGCLYTLAMTGMAQQFTGGRVLVATTMMVMSYTIGGITGPAVAGWAVEWAPLMGPMALFIVASVLGMGAPPGRPGTDAGPGAA